MKQPKIERTPKQAAKSGKKAIQKKVAKNNKAIQRRISPRGKR